MALWNPNTKPGELQSVLDNIGKNLQRFTSHLVSLFGKNDVSPGFNVTDKFIRLRNETAKESMEYFNGALPIFTTIVDNIDDYFDFYVKWSFESWVKQLPAVVNEVQFYKSYRKEVGDILHVEIPFDDKELTLNLIESDIPASQYLEAKITRTENEESTSCKERLYKFIERKYEEFMGLSEDEPARLTAETTDDIKKAIYVFRNELIPSLRLALANLSRIIDVFDNIEEDLIKLQQIAKDIPIDTSQTEMSFENDQDTSLKNVKTSQPNRGRDDNSSLYVQEKQQSLFQDTHSKQIVQSNITGDFDKKYDTMLSNYYILMKETSTHIHDSCKLYHSVLPSVQSDLVAIGEFVESHGK